MDRLFVFSNEGLKDRENDDFRILHNVIEITASNSTSVNPAFLCDVLCIDSFLFKITLRQEGGGYTSPNPDPQIPSDLK